MIRIYKNYDDLEKVDLISSWRALDLLPCTNPGSFGYSRNSKRLSYPNIVTDWQQATGCFIVSGASPLVKVWDAERETCLQVI